MDSDPLVTRGSFAIRFFSGGAASADLEVLNSNHQPLFSQKTMQGAQAKYMVFQTAELLNKYASDQMKAQQALQQQALLKALNSEKGKAMDQKQKIKVAETQVREQEKAKEQVQVSIEQAQVQARMAQLEREAKLSAQQKAAKKAKAAELEKAAEEKYQAQDYKAAASLYQQTAELDPENESAYYKYGICLYKTEDYNQSVAVLSVAEAPEGRQLERDYYLALNHVKLKSYESALKELREIREEQDPELSPMASYFAGTIEMQTQKYPEARKSMEYILDNSKDANLDRSAEQALEQIDHLEAFYNSKKEKYHFSIFGGAIYDGNVVNTATNRYLGCHSAVSHDQHESLGWSNTDSGDSVLWTDFEFRDALPQESVPVIATGLYE